MTHNQINFLFLNIGHFLHLLVPIFATVAALTLADEWHMTYAQLILYATPGFIAYGVCAIPAGRLADKWSREGMMVIFFIGIGLSAMFTALVQTPLQIGTGLLLVGVFAAVYHPVGIAMVVHGRRKTGIPLAINGIFDNMGVAAAALFPINDVLVGRITQSEWCSRVYAIRCILTFSVMASAVPLISWLHATGGFAALFTVMALAASGTFLAVLMLPRTGLRIAHP